MSDEDILNELIAQDLAVLEAKRLGLEVSQQEVDDVISQERMALEQKRRS